MMILQQPIYWVVLITAYLRYNHPQYEFNPHPIDH